MHVTNHANLPSSIIAAVRNDPYPYGRIGDISATSLVSPPQIAALRWLYHDQLEEDAADRIWSLLGQAVHAVLERADPDAETERRLFAECRGWLISGAVDRLVPDPSTFGRVAIEDYKITSSWSVLGGPKYEWIDQLQVLQWLAERNGYRPQRLSIIAILRDWSQHQARRGHDYPQSPVVQFDVPLMGTERLEEWIDHRVSLHQESRIAAQRGGYLPECLPEERWERATVYAVKKEGRKTAVKLHEHASSAQAHAASLPGGYVETRPGESVRCEHYCPVRDFCKQDAVWIKDRRLAA